MNTTVRIYSSIALDILIADMQLPPLYIHYSLAPLVTRLTLIQTYHLCQWDDILLSRRRRESGNYLRRMDKSVPHIPCGTTSYLMGSSNTPTSLRLSLSFNCSVVLWINLSPTSIFPFPRRKSPAPLLYRRLKSKPPPPSSPQKSCSCLLSSDSEAECGIDGQEFWAENDPTFWDWVLLECLGSGKSPNFNEFPPLDESMEFFGG